MPAITLEQALFHRPDGETPSLIARSPGFDAGWIAQAQQIIFGFGDRRVGMRCPLTVFAQPIGANHVAVVRVMDDVAATGPRGLRFHFLIVDLENYDAWIRDPFMLAEKVAPTWEAGEALPALTIAEAAFAPRTLAQLQDVLKRIKAAALKEGEDPEAPDFERTIENSESPALLGGAQILVDGGRLVFERPEGDLRMVSGLWLLLPEVTRCRLWPTSFAFSRDLEFDVLVVPHLDEVIVKSYATEEQAADYPAGTYEAALQQAVESGTQEDLDIVFSRRDSYSTIRLAIICLLLVTALVLLSRL
ncbi:MAG: hypothetical protein HYR84_01160 [Planctomycetes bacterium]|nr:hypothetical protein [Planctomycetota bacterium]